MNQIDNIELAYVTSGLEKVLAEGLGGSFKVTVQKYERTHSGFGDDGFLISFAVKDESAFQRSDFFQLRSRLPSLMTLARFKELAERSSNEVEVIYDVRGFEGDQVIGMTVFLQDLVEKHRANSLPISKSIIFRVDNEIESTDELNALIGELAEAGLKVSLRTSE